VEGSSLSKRRVVGIVDTQACERSRIHAGVYEGYELDHPELIDLVVGEVQLKKIVIISQKSFDSCLLLVE
jgi:hypothetical protein